MVKNSAQKNAARAYQSTHPGTSFHEAMRAVDTRRKPGASTRAITPRPWFQAAARGHTMCLFCGAAETILSYTNVPSDAGRVAVYCDNGRCEVRTVEAVIVRDNTKATRDRADVRALEHFDGGPSHPPAVIAPYEDWIPGAVPWIRGGGDRYVQCLWCGEESSRLSLTDRSDDTGRVQMYCENPDCRVRESEHIVDGDGTYQTDERPDARLLRLLDTPPALRCDPVDPHRGHSYVESSLIDATDDKVARRVSSDPIDWDDALRNW